jgi:hypothetical protein
MSEDRAGKSKPDAKVAMDTEGAKSTAPVALPSSPSSAAGPVGAPRTYTISNLSTCLGRIRQPEGHEVGRCHCARSVKLQMFRNLELWQP